MDFFTVVLVFNASAELFPDNTLSSLPNFFTEQMNLEGQWEVAISEVSYPSKYQNVTEAKFMFFDKTFSKSSELHYLEPGLYPFIRDIAEAMKILIHEGQNHSESCITVKVSRWTQKIEIYLAKKDLVWHAVVRTWDTFSAAMLAMNMMRCWEEKDLTNQILLTTLSAYTLLWYTRSWLSTKSLAAQKPIDELHSFHFEAQCCRHYKYRTKRKLSEM